MDELRDTLETISKLMVELAEDGFTSRFKGQDSFGDLSEEIGQLFLIRLKFLTNATQNNSYSSTADFDHLQWSKEKCDQFERLALSLGARSVYETLRCNAVTHCSCCCACNFERVLRVEF